MNKLLKLSIAGLALTGAASYGQIEINENLSISGFLDMSTVYTDFEEGDETAFNLDQVELDFLFDFDTITAQVDINYLGDNDSGDVDLEQAFLTYNFGEGSSISAGKFLSYHGWETAEPTGLYQYSYAYDLFPTIPGYHNGVSYDYSADWGSFGIALLDSAYSADGSLSEGEYEWGGELKLVLTPTEGLTLYFGYATDQGNDSVADVDLFNFWTSYEWDAHTVAFEYNILDTDGLEDEIKQWLLMYSIAATDTGTFTARISNEDAGVIDADKYTVAWIEALTDNLALVFEYSMSDIGEADVDTFAIEALLTF
ncbi:porin [Puniceicoccaceae bacterium K14]|nr:porin [Puniceicoccaceae bacterium K14]